MKLKTSPRIVQEVVQIKNFQILRIRNLNLKKKEPKPRSFEDEQHQSRMQILKGKSKTKEPYNHYNTFHGSGSLSKSSG